MHGAGPQSANAAMLARRLARVPVVWLLCACFAAAGDEPPANPESSQAAEEIPEFKAPPGFRSRKQGALTLYCRREAVLGSRFKTEKCYDQAGVKALLREERENAELADKVRSCAVGSCPGG